MKSSPAPMKLPVAVLLLASLAGAQTPFLDALPGDTLGVVQFDVDELKEVFQESSTGRLLADPEFDDFRAEIEAFLGELSDASVEETGVDPVEMLDMVSGEVVIALLEMVDSGAVDVSDWTTPSVSLGALVDLGDDIDVFSEDFDKLIDNLVEAEGLVLKTESAGDVDVAVVVDPEDDTVEFRYGFHDSVLLVLVTDPRVPDRDYFGELVDGLAGESEERLTDAPAFRRSAASESDANFRVWFDLGAFLQRAFDFDEASGAASMIGHEQAEALGLTSLGSVSIASTATPERTDAVGHFEFTGGGQIQDVLLAGISEQSPTLSRWMAPDVMASYSIDLDVASMFDTFLGILMQEDPEAARDVIEGMAASEEVVGFNPRDDLIENLDGQLGFFVAEVSEEEALLSEEGQTPTSFGAMFGLSDGEAFRSLIDGLVRSQGLHAARQREEFEGYEIYTVPVFPGVMLAYTVLDDLFVLAMTPSLVKDVLRRKGSADLPSLATDKELGELLADFPTEYTVLVHGRAADQPRSVLQAVSTILDMQGPEANPFTRLLETLADVDPDIVDEYIEGLTLSTMTLREDGIHMQSSSP